MKYLNKLKDDNIINEAIIFYNTYFNTIIKIIKDNSENLSVRRIAKHLLSLAFKDIDTNYNYIDATDRPSLVTFYQDNKIGKDDITYNISSSLYSCGGVLNNAISDIYDLNGKAVDLYKIVNNIKINQISQSDTFKILNLYKYNNPTTHIVALVKKINIDQHSLIYWKVNEFPLISHFKNNPSEIRIGRFIKSILDSTNYNYTNSDIEKFVNEFNAIITEVNISTKIVEGEDIRYWYNEKNYVKGSSVLNSSCMRYEYCQEYLDIYVENPKVCKMLILTDSDNKLQCRALLWTDTHGNKWMDRVYYHKDYMLNIFLNWANKNGYGILPNTNLHVEVKLDEDDFDYYPYLDNLHYFNNDDGVLSNVFSNGCLELINTNGTYD